ncbi:MAG TPA: tyrosine recombinase XerC [Woeseiaceae bacterium]|nr:tyrosine recombinase XerC [Woeseiaceae bacterium]
MDDAERAWIDRFSRHLALERRLSPLTCQHYGRDLDTLAAWCAGAGIASWDAVDSGHIRAFAAALHRQGLSSRSIQRRLSAVRTFYRYLRREKKVRQNPAETVSAPRGKKRLPGNLDADTMARLLDIKGDAPLVVRDRAMLELLYSSGLRLAELIGLDAGDVDLADATVRVTGKGNRERVVPVGRYAVQALTEWNRRRGEFAPAGERALFVSTRGGRISRRAVQARVKYWARRQGIDSRVYPHLFRHSFATHLLESSHDLRGVQELLGHANISTTQVYTHLDFQHLARIYDRTHPRARAQSTKAKTKS